MSGARQDPDPSEWTLPTGPLPSDWLAFLAWSDGGAFRIRDRYIQLFPSMDPNNGVRAMMLAYMVPAYMPGALPFALDGGGRLFLFDCRDPCRGGISAPVVRIGAGALGWDADCTPVAPSFTAAMCGRSATEDGREGSHWVP